MDDKDRQNPYDQANEKHQQYFDAGRHEQAALFVSGLFSDDWFFCVFQRHSCELYRDVFSSKLKNLFERRVSL